MDRRILPRLVQFGRRVRAALFRVPVEREVDEELDFHVEMRVREYVAGGMDEDEARRRALSRFGDIERVKDACRDLGRRREAGMKRRAWWDDVRQDLLYGVRQLGRNRGFTAVAVVTLALGIGANTAVFGIVRGVVLRPLPYDQPGELVSLWTRYLPSSGLDIPRFPLSPPEVLDYRRQTDAMEEVAAYTTTSRTLTGEQGDPERVTTGLVDRALLPLLGVRPTLGRDFTPEEHEPGAAPSVLLSHQLWRDRYGGDPDVVGTSIPVDGQAAQVAGVMPPEFVFPDARVQMWMPLGLDEANPGSRGSHWLVAVGRLGTGHDIEGARAELEAITAGWYEEFEHHAMGHFIFLEPLKDDLVGDARQTLLLLLAAVGLVLLVACGNLANLFLARAEARQREIAVRSALGAHRGRLARQLLTEGAVLAVVGGGAGLLLAWWLTPVLLSIDPTALPRSEGVRVDGAVLAFTLGLVALSTLLFALLPALQAGAGTPARGLVGGRASGHGRGRRVFRRGLIAGQVALSLVVVLAAGLVVRSMQALRTTDPGVEVEGRVAFELALPSADYPDPAAVRVAYGQMLERIEAVPGVRSASAASVLPLSGGGGRGDFLPEGASPPGDGVPAWNAFYVAVRPGWFEAAGVPVLRGRAVAASDDGRSTPVVVVNRTLAERYFPGEEVLGRRLTFNVGADDPTWLTVVGVVGDVRNAMGEEPEPHVYLAHDQLEAIGFGTGRNMAIMTHVEGDPASALAALREAVAEVDPDLPLVRPRTMATVAEASMARPRLAATLMGGFGLLAAVLAAVGIYGVVAWSVNRRTREIGVRMTLGARRARVVGMMVGEGVVPAALGAAVGLGLSLVLGRLLEGMLFQVGTTDPLTFTLLPLGLLAVAAVAGWIPARRASRVAPGESLRVE